MSAPMDIDVMGALERMVGADAGYAKELFGMAHGAAEGTYQVAGVSAMAKALSDGISL